MLTASWDETAKILDGFVACLAAKEDAAIIQASVKKIAYWSQVFLKRYFSRRERHWPRVANGWFRYCRQANCRRKVRKQSTDKRLQHHQDLFGKLLQEASRSMASGCRARQLSRTSQALCLTA